jgi:peroxiredoxin
VAKDFPNYEKINGILENLNGLICPDPAQLPGMVMRTEIKVCGTNLLTITLISAKEEPVDASAFAIPKNYREFTNSTAVAHKQINDIAAAKIQAALQPGTEFPTFSVMDVAGKPLSLALYKGKVVLIDFWATWCLPCRAQIPHLSATYQKYHSQGFDIIGVSLDEGRQKMANFTKENNMTWPQYFDGQGWENELATKYAIRAIPMNYLLDSNGVIIAKDLRGEALTQAVEKAVTHP